MKKPSNPSPFLIQRSQLGDQAAFEEIFHQYKNLVFKTAYLMLNNREDAEDILQAVFIKVYQNMGSYNPTKGAFTTWLHRITVNECLNWRRKLRFKFLSFTRAEEHRSSTPNPEEHVLEDQTMRQALEKLSDKLRAVVVLRYYWNSSYAEIADTLNIPLGTVKSRLSQAIEKLGKTLANVEFRPSEKVSE
ncbi:MAG: RNA polymerase sigma factor [Anaerolineales bacterium]|jgi:RNA polymerase sigma-70 factor (ECF subfamily)